MDRPLRPEVSGSGCFYSAGWRRSERSQPAQGFSKTSFKVKDQSETQCVHQELQWNRSVWLTGRYEPVLDPFKSLFKASMTEGLILPPAADKSASVGRRWGHRAETTSEISPNTRYQPVSSARPGTGLVLISSRTLHTNMNSVESGCWSETDGRTQNFSCFTSEKDLKTREKPEESPNRNF